MSNSLLQSSNSPLVHVADVEIVGTEAVLVVDRLGVTGVVGVAERAGQLAPVVKQYNTVQYNTTQWITIQDNTTQY